MALRLAVSLLCLSGEGVLRSAKIPRKEILDARSILGGGLRFSIPCDDGFLRAEADG
jgi:hypothetical protein